MVLQPKLNLNKVNIAIILLQPIQPGIIDALIQHLEPLFNATCFVENRNLDLDFAYDKERKQFNSTSLLANLKPTIAKNFRALVIINSDIYSNSSTFVFGEAEVNGKIGIISLARLHEYSLDIEILKQRICKEATHEIGHIMGLRHCQNKLCVMSFSPSLAEVEKKLSRFCPDCMHLLVETLFIT